MPMSTSGLFPKVFTPEPCMHLSSPPYMPHAASISFLVLEIMFSLFLLFLLYFFSLISVSYFLFNSYISFFPFLCPALSLLFSSSDLGPETGYPDEGV